MGALGNERLLYLHVPKTGGNWVEAALEAAGVAVRPEGEFRHATLADLEPRERFTLAFVREPVSWYASWWRHCHHVDPNWLIHGLAFPHLPHRYFVNLPLEPYVEAVLDHAPGFLSRRFRDFTGPPEAPISFVGRYEHLAGDLLSALHEAGESFDGDALRAVPPLNTSGQRADLPRSLKKRVREVESEVYERFYPGYVSEPVGPPM